MPVQQAQQRIYHSLNGVELMKAISTALETAMCNDWHFRRNLTYPVVSFKVSLLVSAYPMEPGEFEVEAMGARKDPEFDTTGQEAVTFDVEAIQNVDAPDKIRIEAGLPTHRMRSTEAGATVDEPIEPPSASAEVSRVEAPGLSKARPAPTKGDEAPVVQVPQADGTVRTERVEIPGHNVAPQPVEIPHEPARRVEIATKANPDGFAAPAGRGHE